MMKRITALVLSLLLVIGCLAGCGSNESGSETKKNKVEVKDCKGLEAIKAWQKFEEADYTINLDTGNQKGTVTVSVRKDALSISADMDGIDEVKGEVLRVVDHVLYLNLNEAAIKSIEAAIAEDGLGEQAQEILAELGISLEAGWYAVLRVPDGIEVNEYVYDAMEFLRDAVSEGLLLGEEKDGEIVLSQDNAQKLEDIFNSHVEKDLKTLAEKISKDLQKVDYVGYVKECFNNCKSLIEKYLLPEMGGEFTVDSLWELGIQYACEYLQAKAEDEINEVIYQYIEEANLPEIILSGAKSEDFVMDTDKTYEAEMKDGTLTFVKKGDSDDPLHLTITQNDDRIKAPKTVCDISDYGLAIVGVGVLAPSYLKHINRADNARDILSVKDMMNAAATIAIDIEFDLPVNSEFLIFYEEGVLYLEVQYNGDVLRDATDEWRDMMNIGTSGYSIRYDGYQDYRDGYAMGVVQSNGSVVWESHGQFFDEISDSISDFQ